MPQQSSDPAETDDWDDDDDEWPDDLWPDDEDSPVGHGAGPGPAGGDAPGEGPAWPPRPRSPVPWPPMAGGEPPRRRAHLAAVVAVALIAAGIGAGIVLATRGLSASPAAPASQPTAAAPGGPGGGSGGGATSQMFVGGEVTAVSGTSITVGGPGGQDITAAVTSSTRFTGKVTSISGIKVGDQVTAQLTEHGGAVTAVTITDPGQLSGGGGLP